MSACLDPPYTYTTKKWGKSSKLKTQMSILNLVYNLYAYLYFGHVVYKWYTFNPAAKITKINMAIGQSVQKCIFLATELFYFFIISFHVMNSFIVHVRFYFRCITVKYIAE